MIIDTEALHLRGPEGVSPALAANLLNDTKGIVNLISLVMADHEGTAVIKSELLKAFSNLHTAEQLIRKRFGIKTD